MPQSVFRSPRILRVVLVVLLLPWLLVAGFNCVTGILVYGIFSLSPHPNRRRSSHVAFPSWCTVRCVFTSDCLPGPFYQKA